MILISRERQRLQRFLHWLYQRGLCWSQLSLCKPMQCWGTRKKLACCNSASVSLVYVVPWRCPLWSQHCAGGGYLVLGRWRLLLRLFSSLCRHLKAWLLVWSFRCFPYPIRNHIKPLFDGIHSPKGNGKVWAHARFFRCWRLGSWVMVGYFFENIFWRIRPFHRDQRYRHSNFVCFFCIYVLMMTLLSAIWRKSQPIQFDLLGGFFLSHV